MYLYNINMYCTHIYIYIHFTCTINPLINDYVSGRVDEVKKKERKKRVCRYICTYICGGGGR